MRMPPLPADSIHARACKLKCEKILTRPINVIEGEARSIISNHNTAEHTFAQQIQHCFFYTMLKLSLLVRFMNEALRRGWHFQITLHSHITLPYTY